MNTFKTGDRVAVKLVNGSYSERTVQRVYAMSRMIEVERGDILQFDQVRLLVEGAVDSVMVNRNRLAMAWNKLMVKDGYADAVVSFRFLDLCRELGLR